MMIDWPMLTTGFAGGVLAVLSYDHLTAAARGWFGYTTTLNAHFSPKGGCAAAVVAEIDKARREVLVMAYSFTCPDIAKALIAAAERGVNVHVLLDRSNEAESYSELGDLEQHKVNVLIDGQHAIAHNKVMVIDGWTIVTGSFNFTRQADHENAENLIILKGPADLAQKYRANFHAHRDHCHKPGTLPKPRFHARGLAHAHTA